MSETEPAPSSLLSPAAIRFLTISIIVMTILIILGVGALFYGIKTKLGTTDIQAPIQLEMHIKLAADEMISAYQYAEDGLLLQIDDNTGIRRIVHIDGEGRLTRTLNVN